MILTQFLRWFEQIQQQTVTKKHRSLIVLAGDYSWSVSLIEQIKKSSNFMSKVGGVETTGQNEGWLTYSDADTLNANVTKQNYRYKLGSESQAVVFADSEFNIDALAALSGTIKAGGILFILFPEKLSVIKKNQKSLFLKRFIDKVEHLFLSNIIEQDQELFSYEVTEKNTACDVLPLNIPNILPLNCATQEQYQAVQSIIKVATGHRDRPLVLTADRGRGKSCALAIACAQIIETTSLYQHIFITAPHLKALDNFFQQLKYSLPQAKHLTHSVVHDNGIIEFIPIDKLLMQAAKASLLLVDEAAGIPVYLLTTLLKKYHRVVFSSTVHGYEGAGRGFTLKFQTMLNSEYKTWYRQTISQPIRWAENDPVEKFIFDVCLLNAPLTKITEREADINKEEIDWNFRCLSGDFLLENEDILVQVFAVLVTAHYQTKPSDLKLLLDNPQVSVLCFFSQQKVISVALLMREGSRNQQDIFAVKNAKKRLRDQFLPQSLMTHCGIESAFDFDYLRIIRIAVHPDCHNGGIGTLFLTKIIEYAKKSQVDFIGTSFGCNPQLLNFWLLSHFQLARVGFNKDAASGEHSALMLQALSQKAVSLQSNISREFYQSFIYLLADEYRQLSDLLVWKILKYCPAKYLPHLTTHDLNTVQAFANKERLYSNCAYSLHLWTLHQLTGSFDDRLLPVISRLLKRVPINEVCSLYHLNGKKALNQLMLGFVSSKLHLPIDNN